MSTEKDMENAKSQAKAQLESIIEDLDAYDKSGGEDDSIYEEIMNSALSVEFRSGWVSLPDGDMEPEEFKILLCTGGPAVQIIGELGGHNQPENIRLQYQDWFIPWTDYALEVDDKEALEQFSNMFLCL